MKLQSYQYSPTGFRSPLYGEQKTEALPDDLIKRSWQSLLTDRGSLTREWGFQRKIINRALDKFRYFPEWLAAQETNEKLTKQMRALLEDTVIFINTGKRPMSLTSRLACIGTERAMTNPPRFTRTRHTQQLKKMLAVPPNDYMWHWLMHRGGFNDMVCTLNVFFGDLDAEGHGTK